MKNPSNPTNKHTSNDLVVRISRGTILSMLLGGVLLLLTYSYGRANGLSSKQPAPTKTPIIQPSTTLSPTTSTPKPTSYPKPTPTPIPIPATKVPINIDDGGGITKGTFYCYSDKVNYLSDLQNQIRIYQTSADSCNWGAKMETNNCTSICANSDSSSTCISDCVKTAYSKCNDQNNKVGDLRKKLYSDVHTYCP